MASSENRAEIIKQLLKLIDEIEESTSNPYILSRLSIAKGLVRRLDTRTKPDGDVGDGQR